MKKGKRGVLLIRSIGDDAEHSRVRLRIIRHMGRVRGSTDRVCVRVGGPIDFLAHVKAAREETLHNRPPPATSCDPRTPTRPTFLSSCRRFSPFFLPPNALTSRLPPISNNDAFPTILLAAPPGGTFSLMMIFLFLGLIVVTGRGVCL